MPALTLFDKLWDAHVIADLGDGVALLPVRLPAPQVEALAAEARGGATEITVDLEAQQLVSASGRAIAFEIEPGRREALLEGLDAIGVTLTYAAQIADFQARDRKERPWLYRGLC